MIATDKFVFIHMFRTGGTFINELVGEHMCKLAGYKNEDVHMNCDYVAYHLPKSLMPDKYEQLPIIGFIRNPWDWYISIYYHFLNYIGDHNCSLGKILDSQVYEFNKTIKILLSPKSKEEKVQILNNFPKNVAWNDVRENIRRKYISQYLNNDLGFFTWYFEYMYGKDLDNIYFCKTENLREDFINTLVEINCSITNEAHKHILEAPVLHSFKPKEINRFNIYDDELKELIYTKDRKYIEYFNYSFAED